MSTTQTPADAKALLDVGSELVAGVGGVYELSPRACRRRPRPSGVRPAARRAVVGRLPAVQRRALHDAEVERLRVGRRATATSRCRSTGGLMLRVSPDVTANLMVGTGAFGARGDQVRVTTGIVWAPQPAGAAGGRPRGPRRRRHPRRDRRSAPTSRRTRTGSRTRMAAPIRTTTSDGIADADDQCPNEPEDKDGFQDADGCPDPDNDKDGIPDAIDKCPDEAEDKDGFQDEDGCPDDDNDGDGFPDAVDKCPNDPETVNGFEDDDGCPDVRGTTGPEERADRIDLKGAQVTFARGALTAPSRQLLGQVAALIKNRRLAIRIEVHTALGTRSTSPAQIAAQKRRDKALAQQRAKLIADYLVGPGGARRSSSRRSASARTARSAPRRRPTRSTSASTSSRPSKGARHDPVAARRTGAGGPARDRDRGGARGRTTRRQCAHRRRGPGGGARAPEREPGPRRRRGARSRQHRAERRQGRDHGAGGAGDRHGDHGRRDPRPPVPGPVAARRHRAGLAARDDLSLDVPRAAGARPGPGRPVPARRRVAVRSVHQRVEHQPGPADGAGQAGRDDHRPGRRAVGLELAARHPQRDHQGRRGRRRRRGRRPGRRRRRRPPDGARLRDGGRAEPDGRQAQGVRARQRADLAGAGVRHAAAACSTTRCRSRTRPTRTAR